MERTRDRATATTQCTDMYPVIMGAIEIVTATNPDSMFGRTKRSDRRLAYNRLMAECRRWKSDDEWTLERDVEYIAGIRVAAARNAYIAKMAYWWRCTAFEGLVSREYAMTKEEYLRNTVASCICGFYRFTLTKSYGCISEVDDLYERLLATEPANSSLNAANAARIDTLITTLRAAATMDAGKADNQ